MDLLCPRCMGQLLLFKPVRSQPQEVRRLPHVVEGRQLEEVVEEVRWETSSQCHFQSPPGL